MTHDKLALRALTRDLSGRDRLLERSIWFPYGIVWYAVILSKREAYCMGVKAGTRRSVAEEFRILEAMY